MNDVLIELREIRDSLTKRGPLILEARQQGHTWQSIADATGLSRTQVETIVRRQNGGQLPNNTRGN